MFMYNDFYKYGDFQSSSVKNIFHLRFDFWLVHYVGYLHCDWLQHPNLWSLIKISCR